jgi:hypothetical protein
MMMGVLLVLADFPDESPELRPVAAALAETVVDCTWTDCTVEPATTMVKVVVWRSTTLLGLGVVDGAVVVCGDVDVCADEVVGRSVVELMAAADEVDDVVTVEAVVVLGAAPLPVDAAAAAVDESPSRPPKKSLRCSSGKMSGAVAAASDRYATSAIRKQIAAFD